MQGLRANAANIFRNRRNSAGPDFCLAVEILADFVEHHRVHALPIFCANIVADENQPTLFINRAIDERLYLIEGKCVEAAAEQVREIAEAGRVWIGLPVAAAREEAPGDERDVACGCFAAPYKCAAAGIREGARRDAEFVLDDCVGLRQLGIHSFEGIILNRVCTGEFEIARAWMCDGVIADFVSRLGNCAPALKALRHDMRCDVEGGLDAVLVEYRYTVIDLRNAAIVETQTDGAALVRWPREGRGRSNRRHVNFSCPLRSA